MTDTQKFLELVLPGSGRYSAAFKSRSGGFFHTYYSSVGDLARDALAYNGIHDVYFTSGSVTPTATTATKKDIAQKRAFYLDLDVGEGKPYANVSAALSDLDRFVGHFSGSLPNPVIVGTGNGIHAYWPLTEPVSEQEWTPVAHGLKAVAWRLALQADPSCTADSARVMRLPGTVNLKGGNPSTVLSFGDEPLAFEAYKALFGAEAVVSRKSLFGDVAIPVEILGTDPLTRLLANYTAVKKFIQLVQDGGCNIVKEYVEGGVATAQEPEWRAMLSIANVCSDREDAIVMVSEGHPGYVKEEAFDKASKTSGAYSCKSLGGLFGEDKCKACKHNGRIQNPITLAIASDIVVIGPVPSPTVDPASPVVQAKMEVALPYGYYIRGGAIFTRVAGADDEPREVLVYPTLFYAMNRYSDPVEGEAVSFRLHRAQEGAYEFVVPVRQLVKKDTMQVALATHGVVAFEAGQVTALHSYIGRFTQKLQAESKVVTMHSRCGWSDDDSVFVVGDRAYSAAGVQSFPPSAGLRQVASKMHVCGTFDNWKRVLDLYSGPDLIAHRFALCAAAGAPMLRTVGESGAVINFYSKSSGTGKTTLLRVVASLFGHWKDLLLAQNDTYAAKINRMGVMGNLPVGVDEVTTMTPEETSKFLYSITDGRERNRLSSKANVERTNASQWMTQVITTANAELSAKLELHTASPEGEQARVIDIRAKLPTDTVPQEVDAVLALIRENYGWYGTMLGPYIVANRTQLVGELNAFRTMVTTELAPKPRERFYLNTLIAAYMGSILLERLTGWVAPRKDLLLWFKGRLMELRDSHTTQMQALSNSMSEFLNENRDRILVIKSTVDTRKKDSGIDLGAHDRFIRDARQKLAARWEPDSEILWVVRTEFNRWAAQRRINTKEFLSDMRELHPGSFTVERKRVSKGTSLDIGVVDCLVIPNAKTILGIEFEHVGDD